MPDPPHEAERAQGPEPGGPAGFVVVQAGGVAARACPDFLIHRSCRIESRHDVSKLAPDVGVGCGYRRRWGRLDAAPIERDREVVFKVVRLEDGVLPAGDLSFYHLGDVVEDFEHADETIAASSTPGRVRRQGDGR